MNIKHIMAVMQVQTDRPKQSSASALFMVLAAAAYSLLNLVILASFGPEAWLPALVASLVAGAIATPIYFWPRSQILFIPLLVAGAIGGQFLLGSLPARVVAGGSLGYIAGGVLATLLISYRRYKQ